MGTSTTTTTTPTDPLNVNWGSGSGLGLGAGSGLYNFPSADILIKYLPKGKNGKPTYTSTEIANALANQPINYTGNSSNPSLADMIPYVVAQAPQIATNYGFDANKLIDALLKSMSNGTVDSSLYAKDRTKAVALFKDTGKYYQANGGNWATIDWRMVNNPFTNKPVSEQPPRTVATTPQGTVYAPQTANTQTQINANSAVDQWLSSIGMSDLAPKVNDWIFKQGVDNSKELMELVRTTPEYKQNFAGLTQYNQNVTNGKIQGKPLNETQFLNMYNSYAQIANQYLPAGAVSSNDLHNLVSNGVSLKEFTDRIMNGYNAATNADPNTVAALQAQGVNMKDLAHYYLDPTKATQAILQKTMQATLQGYGADVGVKGLDSQTAANLADYAKAQGQNSLGFYDLTQARKAIEFAAQNVGLSGNSPQGNLPTVSTAQLIGSQIPGANTGSTQAADMQAVKMAGEAQAAPFEKGGGFAESAKGVTGIGAAKD